jgi:phosphoribosylaminoimidazolecarboxamide formyltransferase/IMP cyclohydrolase
LFPKQTVLKPDARENHRKCRAKILSRLCGKIAAPPGTSSKGGIFMKRALLSVSDKAGIAEFAQSLADLGFSIISTGGTYKALKEANVAVTEISEVTQFPECLDGRLKTLHPKIHGGILGIRDNPNHTAEMEKLALEPIDIVAVNLYPFKSTILKEGVTLETAIEKIDIGGPTMLRAAAKNYRFVSVVCDPSDYSGILAELKENGKVSEETNFKLSAKVFMHTAAYDALIASYLKPLAGIEQFPQTYTVTYEKAQDMRYGENPHQNAAFYREIGNSKGLLSNIEQLHGKELSFNNINDSHGALELLKE